MPKRQHPKPASRTGPGLQVLPFYKPAGMRRVFRSRVWSPQSSRPRSGLEGGSGRLGFGSRFGLGSRRRHALQGFQQQADAPAG
jgi:hypothetical protein